MIELSSQVGPRVEATPVGSRSSGSIGRSTRSIYLRWLGWAFTAFNSIRVLTYLPTIAAIWSSGNSTQHSLVTWLTWSAANVTMAAWLYENNGQRLDRSVAVNIGNAAMCIATTFVIVACRF